MEWFILYESKLHKDLPFFWQCPRRNVHFTDDIWYDRIRVGHDPIENFMGLLSKEANLSKRYTNHSIRSTVIGILEELYQGRHVIGLSGHKSENTIKQYATKLPAKIKRDMANTLCQNVQPAKVPKLDAPQFKFKKIAPATVSQPPPEPANQVIPQQEIPADANGNNGNNNNNDQIQFQLQDLDDAPPDDILINFLNQFDPVTENPPPAPHQPEIPPNAPILPQMNIQNVSNVQNNQGVQRLIPNMYFGGNSNVTINYNFGPQK